MKGRGIESQRSWLSPGKIERAGRRKQKRVDYTQRKVSRLGIGRENRQIYPRKESGLGIEEKIGEYTQRK